MDPTRQASQPIVIIGAGPSGSVSAALLHAKGHPVLILEKSLFPRFSIGESLLPQCMAFIDEAGMMDAVEAAAQKAGFQFKAGAAFARGEQFGEFDFRDKSSAGWDTTYQVPRANFDKVLADEATRQGVEIRYQHEILDIEQLSDGMRLTVKDPAGQQYQVDSPFVLDASGFGRTLPRLLQLERPSDFPVRHALFGHVEDRINHPGFDREKILISVHPQHNEIWFWLIPFSNGRASIGAVIPPKLLESYPGDAQQQLQTLIDETPNLRELLQNAQFDSPINCIQGYSCNVSTLCGPHFALLGNAGEFLDPVFSSGVTIAMKSASLATGVLHRQLSGESVDWQREYADALMVGVNTFRAYVDGWYSGTLQDVIFYKNKNPEIKRMVCSILAGYAWDQQNPFVANPVKRLTTLGELCRAD